MSLATIANFVQTDAGVPADTFQDLAFLYDRINRSAEEIYTKNDLPKSLMEVYVSINSNNGESFTLPDYVKEIRGVRRPMYDTKNGMTFTSTVPRYAKQTWGDLALDNFRLVGYSPTRKDISLEQDITVEISRALDKEVAVIVIGNTEEEQGVIQEIIFPVGTLSVTFSSLFTEITSVVKREFFFATVTGTEENTPGSPLFTIPANQNESYFVRIQIQDQYMFQQVLNQWNFELLFKRRLPIMYSPNSEFIVPRVYDQCIAWYTIAQYIKGADDSAMYMSKCVNRLAELNSEQERGQKVPMNVSYNKHAETYDRLTFNL